MKLKITFQEFGRGPVTTRRLSTLAEAAAYIAERWQGDEYRDGPASFHTDYCTYQCHGFTLEQVRPKPACRQLSAAQIARQCKCDDCDAGAHCRTCGGHFLDWHNANLRGCECDGCKCESDPDGPGINGPEPVFQAGLDDGECGYSNGVHWSDPAADFPRH